MVIIFMVVMFVIILSIFAFMFKQKCETTTTTEGFQYDENELKPPDDTNLQLPTEQQAYGNNVGSTKPLEIKWRSMIYDLTSWSRDVNKIIIANKIVPSFGFTKIREYVSRCIDDIAPKDGQQVMHEIAKKIEEQQTTEGFRATFEETELINELKDIIRKYK